ncbi:MAG: hypothetical protein MZU91_11780 [Desulfosudis oleivorans]|nr:hypothetical protein [Desulfosudis oleivorans]
MIGHPSFKGSPKKGPQLHCCLGGVSPHDRPAVFTDIKGMILSSAGRNPTLTDRTVLWEKILKLPVDPWLGTGWDNFWLGDRVAPLWEKWWWHPPKRA